MSNIAKELPPVPWRHGGHWFEQDLRWLLGLLFGFIDEEDFVVFREMVEVLLFMGLIHVIIVKIILGGGLISPAGALVASQSTCVGHLNAAVLASVPQLSDPRLR